MSRLGYRKKFRNILKSKVSLRGIYKVSTSTTLLKPCGNDKNPTGLKLCVM